MTDMEILGAAMSYTDKTVEGAGGLKGANCTIQSIVDITGGHRVTFAWKDNNDETQTSTMDVMDGEKGSTGETGPAGVGIASIEKTETSGLVDTYTITYTNGDTDTFTVTNGSDATVTVDSELSDESENPVQNKVIKNTIDKLDDWTTAEAKSVSGNPITLTDGSARNAEGLSVECEPKQNLHGYDHPWAGGAGKNKLNSTLPATSQGGLDYTPQGNGIYKINGTASSNGGADFAINVTLKAGTYKILGLPSGVGSTNTYIGLMLNGSYVYTTNNESFTLSEDTTFDSLKFRPGQGTQLNNVIVKPMISSDTSVTYDTYEPYSNECPITGYTECAVDVKDEEETTQDTAIITFGQTVYGAIVNPKTGKVTVTHGYITLDGDAGINYGFMNYWESATDYKKYLGRTSSNVGNRRAVNASTDIVAISDKFNGVPWVYISTAGNICAGTDIDDAIYLDFGEASGLDTTAKQLAWLAQNPVQVCYELATPIELYLTPAELELLKGYNYITSNGTTIALAYLPDSLLAEAENYADAKIPPAPTTDGTYVLTCTVTSGTPAYSWESAT